MGNVLRQDVKRLHTLPKFFAAIALSFSCLSLSVLPMSKGWTQEVTSSEINSYLEKIGSNAESERATEALQKLGSKAVPDLVKALQNKDAKVRSSAANALGSIGKKAASAVPALTEALQDKEAGVRKYAASALGYMGKDAASAVPALAEALQDKEADVRSSAASALGNIGKDAASAVPALTKALQDKEADVRSSAAYALGNIGKDAASAVPALAEALHDKEAEVRSSAAYALGNIGKDAASAVPALAEALQDKEADVRSNAASALGSIGEKAASATPVLTEALKNDKEADVRSNAASALGSIGFETASAAKSVVPVLIGALNDEDIRENAIFALAFMAVGYQDQASKLSSRDLDTAISNMEKAVKATAENKSNSKDLNQKIFKVILRNTLNAFKKEKDSRFFDRTLQWMVKHPWVTGALIYIIFVPSLWFALLRLRPLWLLHINNALKPFSSIKLPDILGGGTLPIRTLLFIEFFNYRPRVLDAWVTAHIDSAKEGFGKKKTVSDRFVHIPIPVILDNNNLAHLTGKDLQPTFDKKRASLLLWGEGGAGKTSLACQLAVWAMSDDANQRISQHKMLPVLIEQELDFDVAAGKQPLTEAICGQLQALIGEAEPIPEESRSTSAAATAYSSNCGSLVGNERSYTQANSSRRSRFYSECVNCHFPT